VRGRAVIWSQLAARCACGVMRRQRPRPSRTRRVVSLRPQFDIRCACAWRNNKWVPTK